MGGSCFFAHKLDFVYASRIRKWDWSMACTACAARLESYSGQDHHARPSSHGVDFYSEFVPPGGRSACLNMHAHTPSMHTEQHPHTQRHKCVRIN